MIEDRADKVRIDGEKFRQMSKEDHAEICTMVVEALVEKAEELGELYKTLMTTYKDEMLITGISVVCAVNSEAIPADDAPLQFLLGTPEGIMHTVVPLMKVVQSKVVARLRGVADDSDEETA